MLEKNNICAQELIQKNIFEYLNQFQVKEIDNLFQNKNFISNKFKNVANKLVKKFPENPIFHYLSEFDFDQVLKIWKFQIISCYFKYSIQTEKKLFYQEFKRPFQVMPFFGRKHHQLICNSESIFHKIEWIETYFSKESQILILGDDDQLSIGLMKRGFQNITVIDIDATLIQKIQKECQNKVRAAVHNLEHTPPEFLKNEYDCVVMDPPYSIEGIHLFLNGALKMCRNKKPVIHLYCSGVFLGEKGSLEFLELLKKNSLYLKQVIPSICAYPYSKIARAFFVFLYCLFTIKNGLFRKNFKANLIPKQIYSDLFIFEPEMK